VAPSSRFVIVILSEAKDLSSSSTRFRFSKIPNFESGISGQLSCLSPLSRSQIFSAVHATRFAQAP
jgi:hypothetical protein